MGFKSDIEIAQETEMLHIREIAKIAGEELPDYFKNHPVYYAGPAKTPEGMPCGSMGPN